MGGASKNILSERGSLTAVEAAITMSIGLLFTVAAYIFQHHSADITSHDKCVMQKMAELDGNGQPKYNMADPDLLSKINIDCPGGSQ